MLPSTPSSSLINSTTSRRRVLPTTSRAGGGVTACRRTKPPVIDRWEMRASTDPDQIHRWWRHLRTPSGSPPGPSGWTWSTSIPANTQPAPDRWTTLGVSTSTGVLCTLGRQQHTTVTPTYAVTTRVALVLHRPRRGEESGGWGASGLGRCRTSDRRGESSGPTPHRAKSSRCSLVACSQAGVSVCCNVFDAGHEFVFAALADLQMTRAPDALPATS
jgi:Bifunctional DNA primase/polymerase, N-terminal